MRKYEFEDGYVYKVNDGGFLSKVFISALEMSHGTLKSVSYKGRTVLAK